MQRNLPRPSLANADKLLNKVSEISDPSERSIAREIALLVINDALKYPDQSAPLKNGPSIDPLEDFDDEVLKNARLAIAQEIHSSSDEEKQKAFETTWMELHDSSILPGLDECSDDHDSAELRYLERTLDVSFPAPCRL